MIILTIGIFPFPVQIALVAGDDDTMTVVGKGTDTLEQICRTHHIGSDRIKGILVGGSNKGLRREMEDDVGLHLLQDLPKTVEIPHVAAFVACQGWLENPVE